MYISSLVEHMNLEKDLIPLETPEEGAIGNGNNTWINFSNVDETALH